VGDELDASLRGTLVHAALKEWAEDLSQVPPGERLALLLAKGQSVFAPYMDMPEVSKFWWPRFERMAVDFIALDKHLRRDVIGTRVELSAEMTVDIQGTEHVLTARADRIDILQNGDLHIIDYKTGGHSSMKQVASGFAPQLTLEAALAQAGAFKSVEAADVHDVSYLTVGGGKSVEQISLAKDHDVATEAAKALQGFIALMQAYRNPDTRYIPRHNPEYGGEHAEYDHLSRYQEWSAEAPEP